jgi:hypothetical protein
MSIDQTEKPASSMTTIPSAIETIHQPAPAPISQPMQMLQKALEKDVSVEVLAKLLDLQERWEATQARREFDAAFAAVKAEVGIIKKTGVGHNRTAYASMADIARALDPIIAKHGLSYRFRSQRVGNEMVMTCVVCHRAGHFEENSLPAPLDTSGSKNPTQAVGSTSTYLQRYTLVQAFGLAASVNGDVINDDDGQGASVKNGWPQGSVYQQGDYAGGTPERDTKPKQENKYTKLMNAAATHLSRANAMAHELENCEHVPELDAMAIEIEARPEYKQLPQTMKEIIAKAYAATLARLESTYVEVPDEPEPAPPPPEPKSNGITERAIEARNQAGGYEIFSEPQWLGDLGRALEKCSTADGMATIKEVILLPAKGKASAKTYQLGCGWYHQKLDQIGKP